MDKQTQTQIATQSMKGCGTEWNDELGFTHNPCGDYGFRSSSEIDYCPSCKSKILAYRTAWENELEWLKNSYGGKHGDQDVDERISELTSALRILEIS